MTLRILVLFVLIIIQVFLNVFAASDKLPDESVCGIGIFIFNRVFGGDETEMGEFPWMVALEYRKRENKTNSGILCGGTLINSRYVLTAAHCLTNSIEEVFQVRLGEWNTASDPDCNEPNKTHCNYVQNLKVDKIIPHPFYNGKSRNNDIGLIRLESDIVFSDFVRPICLASMTSPSLHNEKDLVVTGWGLSEQGVTSSILLKVTVPYVNNTQCKQVQDPTLIRLNQMCAGGVKGKDTCEGDSGGPLMRVHAQANKPIQWYQEGVVSWGGRCGFNKPAVYTKVRRYKNWIETQLE